MAGRITLNGASLSIEQVARIARNLEKVEISRRALLQVKEGRTAVERILKSGRIVYGINTGFGRLVDRKIEPDELSELQLNLIRSHSVGTGPPLSEQETRAVMAIRLNSLLKGNSGVRPALVQKLQEFLNRKVYPEVPRYGSLGASGDLAPSAHLALCLVGEGRVFQKGRLVRTSIALKKMKVHPIKLAEKEGLSVINGTQVMTGLGCLLVLDASSLLRNLDIAAAMTVESLGGSMTPFDSRVHDLRPLQGQKRVADRIRKLLADSALVEQQARVQDPYSLRCIPQVHGAFYDALNYARSALEVEINSVTDNPIVVPKSDAVLHSGNFHGQPISLALDFLCVAIAEASVYSERRIDKLLSGFNSRLPIFLTKKPGVSSGLMVLQYTAAALVSENRILARPASLDNATVSAGQEDHASMGMTAALKARTVLENTLKVIAIEMICAAQASDLVGAGKMGQGTRIAYSRIRKITRMVVRDRSLSKDIERVASALRADELGRAIERVIRF